MKKRKSKSGKNGAKPLAENSDHNSENGRVRSLANLEPHRFKPGQSGNPGGRPSRKPLTAALEKQLAMLVPNDPHGRSYLQLMISASVKRAIKKSDVLVKEIVDRLEGKVASDEEARANEGVKVIILDVPRPDRSKLVNNSEEE